MPVDARTDARTDAHTSGRTTSTRWDPVLAGIRADALDCLQSTVAAVADEAYGTGSHLELGSRWRFPVRGADGAVGVQPTVAERMAQARDVLGFEVGEPSGPLDSAALRHLADTAPVYVVAEAYDLGWLPYARATTRYREMPHSFLLEKAEHGYTVVDAYYADTQWGRARPSAWTLSADALDEAMAGPGTAVRLSAGSLPAVERATVMAENAATARAAEPAIDAYVETALDALGRPEGIERLVLDIWHLCRERLLHSLWLGEHPAAAAVREEVESWQRLAGQSYLASRRALRGAPPNPVLVRDLAERLRSDVALAVTLAERTPVPDARSVTGAVIDVVRSVLGPGAGVIEPASVLRTLPGYSSFRLVEIIDRLELRLGLPFPDNASADDLADVSGLCRLFARAAQESRR